MKTPQQILDDPIVMGAIAAQGLDAHSLPWSDKEEYGIDQVEVNGTRSLPSIQIGEDGEAHIRWYREAGMVVYTLDGEGGIMTVEQQETPETLLVAMKGRCLTALVDVPGADRMNIVDVVNSSSFAGNPFDTRAQVELIF